MWEICSIFPSYGLLKIKKKCSKCLPKASTSHTLLSLITFDWECLPQFPTRYLAGTVICGFSEYNLLLFHVGSYSILFLSCSSLILEKYFTRMVNRMEKQRGLIILFKSIRYIESCCLCQWHTGYASTNLYWI